MLHRKPLSVALVAAMQAGRRALGFDNQLWLKGERRPQQGEMRLIRDAGLALEHPDHTFTLTDTGRAVLAVARRTAAR